MEVRQITPDQFARRFDGTSHLYNRVAFAELNRAKADEVRYLAIGERLGVILGVKPRPEDGEDKKPRSEDGEERALYTPFSASFGGLVRAGLMATENLEPTDVSEPLTDREVDQAVAALAEYGRKQGMKIIVTLPPAIYALEFVQAQEVAMERHGRLMYSDINHYFPLSLLTDPEAPLHRTPRLNYRTSLERDYHFERMGRDEASIARAYDVIKANREARGYPLRMSLETVKATAPLADALFGVLSLDGEDIAAVQLHRVTDDILQVVYWGNDPRVGGNARPMVRLAVEVYTWCRDLGVRVLDIGPSSSHGVPSPGLCSFKQSVGCISMPKKTYVL